MPPAWRADDGTVGHSLRGVVHPIFEKRPIRRLVRPLRIASHANGFSAVPVLFLLLGASSFGCSSSSAMARTNRVVWLDRIGRRQLELRHRRIASSGGSGRVAERPSSSECLARHRPVKRRNGGGDSEQRLRLGALRPALADRQRRQLLASPLSADLALTMTYAGAQGETATQMASVLQIPPRARRSSTPRTR